MPGRGINRDGRQKNVLHGYQRAGKTAKSPRCVYAQRKVRLGSTTTLNDKYMYSEPNLQHAFATAVASALARTNSPWIIFVLSFTLPKWKCSRLSEDCLKWNKKQSFQKSSGTNVLKMRTDKKNAFLVPLRIEKCFTRSRKYRRLFFTLG